MKAGIIGGGISGLTVGYYLQKLGIPYDLFEASEGVGGKIRTQKVKNYILEMGPSSLLLTDELQELIQDLKLEDELLIPDPSNRERYILKDGIYQKLPSSKLGLASSQFFSTDAKMKIAQEKSVPAANLPGESVAAFFERRLCREVVDYVVDPLVSDAFAGDPEQLLMSRALPKIVDYEKKNGTILKEFLKNQIKNRRGVFTFKEGLQTLPEAIASKLISLHTGQRVEMVTRSRGRYILSTNPPSEHDSAEYDVLVLALPAHHAAHLLEFTFPGFSAALQNITYPPVVVVQSVYPAAAVKEKANGLGGLHPKVERMFTSSNVWNSSVFPSRCDTEEVMFTSFVGGAMYAHHAQIPRTELLQRVHEELKKLFSIEADKPVFQYYHMWQHAMPQFNMYIEDAHHMADRLEPEGIFVASNWLAGISVPACIRNAKSVAQKISSLATSNKLPESEQ